MLDPTLNKNAGKEVFDGVLHKAGSGAIVSYGFKYGVLNGRRFQSTVSVLPMEYVAVTEVIRTSDALLPFAKGDKVTLVGGKTMTVQAVEEYRNPALYTMGFTPIESLTITLEGGGK